MENSENLYVVILAAGKGKRMKQPGKAKVMTELKGKTLIERVLEDAKKLNPQKIVIVVGYQKDDVIEYLSSPDADYVFVEQNEQLGTGHAVAQAEKMIPLDEANVLILCGDVPNLRYETLSEFISKHYKNNSDVSVLSTIASNPSGYGRIVRNDNGDFVKITEEKDADDEEKKIDEINSGVFLVKSNLLFPTLKRVSNDNAQGEYYLTDIIDILKKENKRIFAFPLADFKELQGVNSPEDLKKAETYLKSLS